MNLKISFDNKIDRLFNRDLSGSNHSRFMQRLGVLFHPDEKCLVCQVMENSDEVFCFAIRYCEHPELFRILTIEQAQQIESLSNNIPYFLTLIH